MPSLTTARRGTRVCVAIALVTGLLGLQAAETATAQGSGACRPVPSSLRLSDDSVVAGSSLVGTLRLTCRAPRRTAVTLHATSGLSAPATVSVKAGHRRARFTIVVADGQQQRAERLTASRGAHRTSADLAVTPHAVTTPVVTTPVVPCSAPPVPQSISVPQLHEGETVTASVTLSCTPSTPTKVELYAGWQLHVPDTVTVPGGSRSATFPVSVVADAPAPYPTYVFARLNGVDLRRDDLVVQPTVSGLYATPDYGPWTVSRSLEVDTSGPAPVGGMSIHIASSHPTLIAPMDVVVPAGSTRIDLPLPVHDPVVDATVTLTASLDGGPSRVTEDVTLWARPPIPGALHIGQNSPLGPVTSNSGYARMWVKIDAPAPSGSLYAHLTSDHPEAFPPLNVLIYTGDEDGIFDWLVGPVDQDTIVTITGTIDGYSNLTGSFQVKVRPGVDHIDVPNPIVSGVPFTATVHMAGPTDIDRYVDIYASSPVSCQQPTGLMPAGATTTTATCVAQPVAAPTTAHLGVQVEDDDGDFQDNFGASYPVVPAPGP